MSEKSPEDPESRYVDKRFNNIIEREFNDAVAELDPSYQDVLNENINVIREVADGTYPTSKLRLRPSQPGENPSQNPENYFIRKAPDRQIQLMLGELQKEFHFRQQHPEPSPSVTKGQQRQAKKLISNVNGQQVVMEHILHKEGEEPKMFMVTVYKYGPK